MSLESVFGGSDIFENFSNPFWFLVLERAHGAESLVEDDYLGGKSIKDLPALQFQTSEGDVHAIKDAMRTLRLDQLLVGPCSGPKGSGDNEKPEMVKAKSVKCEPEWILSHTAG